MFRSVAVLLLSSCVFAQTSTAAPRGCVASVPLGTFQLSVKSPQGGDARPIRQQNILEKGYKIAYSPVQIPPDLKKAKMCLILVPVEATDENPITVLDAVDADEPAEWEAPFRTSVVGVVFGPQGLDRKKVSKLVKKDSELISQLADYAEQTSQVETLVEALANAEQGSSRSKNLQAALNGFAARSGASMTKIDPNAPTDQQAALLLRTLNPALASYDPLAAQSTSRMQQGAGLAASVAGLFFGSSVGLAAGGAAMAQNMRTILFPDTDFRSALVQSADANAMTMCAKREQQKSRTRMAYLWANRIPNAAAPEVTLASATHIPAGVKSSIPLRSDSQFKYLDRAHDWALVASDGASIPVTTKVAGKALEMDLSGSQAKPGTYKIAAKWDWDAFEVKGDVQVHELSDLKQAEIVPPSRDMLVEGSGPVTVKLTGADFQFIEKVSLKGGSDLAYKLPQGKRAGPQDSMEVTVDTAKLKAGNYQLVLTQPTGAQHEIAFRLLPPHPRIENLPLRANLGDKQQQLVLRGSGLERIESITVEQASVELGPVQKDKTRVATIHLQEGPRKGDRLALAMKVEGVHEPLSVANAVEVAGPRPKIESVKGSWPDELGVAVRDGELPAGSFVSFSMRVENVQAQPTLKIGCQEAEKTLQAVTLRPGGKQSGARLETAGQNVLFVSFDPGALGQEGCTLATTIEAEASGVSDPHVLGRVIRLPRIETFTMTDEKVGDSAYAGVLTGQDLETIERTGWIAKEGVVVDNLPRPVAGEAHKQTLKVALPWPSPAPKSPVYIWLRGEKEGRLTKAKY